jgi:hypothetical protein
MAGKFWKQGKHSTSNARPTRAPLDVGRSMLNVECWLSFNPRLRVPPESQPQQPSQQYSHQHRPTPEVALLAVIILPALPRQQVKARARLGLFTKEHLGNLSNPPDGDKPSAEQALSWFEFVQSFCPTSTISLFGVFYCVLVSLAVSPGNFCPSPSSASVTSV